MKVTAIVLSAGKGTRVGSDIPKQYIEVAGKPVLAYCLESFERSEVDDIVIVTSAGNEDYVKEQIVDRFGFSKVSAVVAGGSERYYSVLNGLRHIAEASEAAVDSCGYVLIHDGARPYITESGVNKMISAVKLCKAAVAAQPARDTIKITDRDGYVVQTTERANTWQVQTPQCFEFGQILKAYEMIVGDRDSRSGESGRGKITDDAMVYESEFPDRRVKLIDLNEENSKITTAADLKYMAWKFGEQYC